MRGEKIMNALHALSNAHGAGCSEGFWSCCSANRYVLRAAARRARMTNTPLLIEATANQVNQYGGYTGMTPAEFRMFAYACVREEGYPAERLILGGDHLGPLTWTGLDAGEAMERARALVAAYVTAGYEKIHIDTSMRLGGDDPARPLTDETIAARAATLCAAAEEAYAARRRTDAAAEPPVYVVGSEVPVPGGAQEALDAHNVTDPRAFENTIDAFSRIFSQRGLDGAFSRIAAVVVQPGVEFGDEDIEVYDRAAAKPLTDALLRYPSLCFEGHSTDYQPKAALKSMVEDGIGILKVGPALTFALREALFALENMERELMNAGDSPSCFRETLEEAMLASPDNWIKHYHGDDAALRFKRAFSQSDRARYYLATPSVRESIERLLEGLTAKRIPLTLAGQYLPLQCERIRDGILAERPVDMLIDHVGDRIDDYIFAIRP